MEYNKGDYVIYGTNGICKIDDIQKMTFPMETEEHTYYILKPISNKSSILFVPSNRPELVSKMRYILTRDEIDNILSSPKEKEMQWIEDKNARASMFKNMMREGSPEKLLKLIKCLYERKSYLLENGKKLTITDDNVLTSAEKLVCEEFAFALGIDEDKVAEYIKNKIEN